MQTQRLLANQELVCTEAQNAQGKQHIGNRIYRNLGEFLKRLIKNCEDGEGNASGFASDACWPPPKRSVVTSQR